MANAYKNKIIFNGNTLIDISDTTAVASDVSIGKSFYLADGSKANGTAPSVDYYYISSVNNGDGSQNLVITDVANGNDEYLIVIEDNGDDTIRIIIIG